MSDPAEVAERLATAAATWSSAAADLVPSLPVHPEVASSYEAHLLATICVELLQPLAATAARWGDDGATRGLGRVEVKLQHVEAIGRKVGRDLGLGPAIAETRAALAGLRVRSTASRREAGAPSAWFAVSVDAEEARVAVRVLRSLAGALGDGSVGLPREDGAARYRFRDGPGVVAFWSMKVETCSPGVTQRFSLRLARRSPRKAIADAVGELLARLRAEPVAVATSEPCAGLIALCERSLADLA